MKKRELKNLNNWLKVRQVVKDLQDILTPNPTLFQGHTHADSSVIEGKVHSACSAPTGRAGGSGSQWFVPSFHKILL